MSDGTESVTLTQSIRARIWLSCQHTTHVVLLARPMIRRVIYQYSDSKSGLIMATSLYSTFLLTVLLLRYSLAKPPQNDHVAFDSAAAVSAFPWNSGVLGVSAFNNTMHTTVPSASRQLQQTARYSPPYKICVSDWAPIVYCSGIDDPAHFKGYHIELFSLVAKDLGWAPDDWSFSCMTWSDMMNDVLDPAGSCYMSAAGNTQ